MAPKNKKGAKAEPKPQAEAAKAEEPKADEPAAAPAPKAKAEPKADGKKKAAAKAEPKAKAESPVEESPKEEAAKEEPKFDDKGMRITVERADVEKFLAEGVKKMQNKKTKAALADKSAGRPGGLLIEIQQKVWDDMKVNRNVGRQAVDELEKRFEEDAEELVKARDLFIRTAQLTYLQSLEDRKPDPLETEAELTREAVLEFCDACCAKADLKETKDAMGAKLKEGEMPDQVILDIQMDMFETLGYEREHGKDSLEKLETLYPKDQELMRSTSIWQNKGQTTCLVVLDRHMLDGGELPENPQKEALELQVLQHRAKEQLSKMTAQTRGELFEKLRQKVQIFRNLPPEIRQKHMQKLPLDDKIDLIKGDVLFATVAQQQQQQQQRQEQRKQYEAHMKRQLELKAAADEKQAAFEVRKAKAHAKANMKKHAC